DSWARASPPRRTLLVDGISPSCYLGCRRQPKRAPKPTAALRQALRAMIRTLCLGSPLVLIAAAGAQIPVGAAVVTTISDPTNPIMIIERGTPPTILPFTGSVLDEINAFRIDPIANLVWMAGINDGSVRIAQMLYPAR